MADPAVCVGIDVAKATLDVAVRPSGERWQLANDEAALPGLVLSAVSGNTARVGWAFAHGPLTVEDVQAAGELLGSGVLQSGDVVLQRLGIAYRAGQWSADATSSFRFLRFERPAAMLN